MTDTSAIIPSNDDTFKFPKVKGSSVSNTLKRGSTVTVILKPHNSSFQPRTLELRDKAKVRIGRQTSSKTSPSVYNGYFDSKVLSRQHAEIWCERSTVYIKDVKSSNGTFVNGQRLSNEGEESEPKELHHQDEIEFGIDIVSDTGSIMYHKVACSLYIFPLPLSQVDNSVIRDLFNNNNSSIQIYPDSQSLSRKSSASSLATISSAHSDLNGSNPPLLVHKSSTNTINGTGGGMEGGGGGGLSNVATNGIGGKKARKLESILLRLQSELDKSRSVEKELKTAKDVILGLDKSIVENDKKKQSDELRLKLTQAEKQLKAFDEKWRHQSQAINTAKEELHKMKNTMEKSAAHWKSCEEDLKQQLKLERGKVKQLQHEIERLSSADYQGYCSLQVN
ncbi:Uncharacterized protein C3H7.13 [Choanephora cucurbitarum]|uniref:Uncharacterized protein C3H7.13 n=1 Tax=Choanephora cucurbitarum TaxID=101091 RepID=A0A1C7NQQ0_9FUNG|nr:Uncharacterized protein C3H7.13 [Choanephora cucurbitarum]